MKVLIVNYRYFVSGGPERYLFNVKALLESYGHEVIPFSIAYDQNEPSEYSRYFASPLSRSSEIYFRDHRRGLRAQLRSIERSVYSRSVYHKLAALVADTRPDVALVLHYLRKLSPAVLKCLADHYIPFAVRLSDFAMVCPNAHLVRNSQPCELCVQGAWRHSVRHACVQGSVAASSVNYLATRLHQAAGYYDLIRTFIAPSRFTITKMIEGGWDPARFVHIPTFVGTDSSGPPFKEPTPLVVYAGRLEPTKGLETLLDAALLLERMSPRVRFEIRFAGGGESEYVASLRGFVARHNLRSVRLLGLQSREQVTELLRRAWCSVVPSLWYENMPNSALESMAQATPVIASDHGSLPEIVHDGATGWLTPPGDAAALAQALRRVITGRDLAAVAGGAALQYVRREHSPEAHYRLLMATFAALGAPASLREAF